MDVCECVILPPSHYRHLGSQLIELEKAIEKMMENDFVRFALEDIQHRIKNSSTDTVGTARAETEVSIRLLNSFSLVILLFSFSSSSSLLLAPTGLCCERPPTKKKAQFSLCPEGRVTCLLKDSCEESEYDPVR